MTVIDRANRPTAMPIRGTFLGRFLPSLVLIIGSIYTLFPIAWLILASTKTSGELFSTPTMLPGLDGGFVTNVVGLLQIDNGVFVHWAANSVLFAFGGAIASTAVATLAGYALSLYRFSGRNLTFAVLTATIMIPGLMLAIPQYLIASQVHLANTYLAVLIPSAVSPVGIFLMTVFTRAAVPEELLEAGRLDGAGEYKILFRLSLPNMVPGLVTVFLLQFVGIWNNFLLPYVMLADSDKFPITVGLYSLLNRGTTEPALYNLAITGAVVSIVPLAAVVLIVQRFWRADLLGGALKG